MFEAIRDRELRPTRVLQVLQRTIRTAGPASDQLADGDSKQRRQSYT
jgi:hypothetical protein